MQINSYDHGNGDAFGFRVIGSGSIAYPWSVRVAIALMSLAVNGYAADGDVSLAWDAVLDDRVAVYELHYGQQSGLYDRQVDAETTAATVIRLTEGSTYYFAVKACDRDRTLCSAFSNEVSTTVNAGTGNSAPVANAGPAPMVSGVEVQDSGSLIAQLQIKSGGPPRTRAWDLVVTNPNGRECGATGRLDRDALMAWGAHRRCGWR